MPTVTRTVAKGIPPRVRSPSKSKKKSALKRPTKPAKKHHKRNASASGDDESEKTSESDGSEPKPKKKKRAKRQRLEESDSEVEIVDDGAEPEPLVEEVREDDPARLSSDEVSKTPHWNGIDSHNVRRMGLTIINVAETSKKGQ